MTEATDLLRRDGREALATGNVEKVRRIAAALQKAAGGAAEGYFLLSVIEAEAGRIGAALPLIRAATARLPTAEYEAHMARLLLSVGRDGDARQAAARAEALQPEDALTFDTIGCVHTRFGAHIDATRLFEQAVLRAPQNNGFRYNLAVALSFVGRVKEAEDHLNLIIAAEPTNGRAHFALSNLKKQSPARNHILRLEGALISSGEENDRLRIRYALAKEYEDCDQPREAFSHLQAANEQRRRHMRYDFEQDARTFDAVERLFAGGNPLAGKGIQDESPIFVVGMPRSGTTLVERILSSHKGVRSAGELQAMPLAIKQLSGSRTRTLIDADSFAKATRLSASEIGDLYLARAKQQFGAREGRFVDKLPANFLFIGFIRYALPAARIVCLRRDPMDTIWAIYRNLFSLNSSFYRYASSPLDIARYYIRFDRLMSFWRNAFPEGVFELEYERLVADQVGTTQQLLSYCGLEWDEACLQFHENEAAVATPSAPQVRRPIAHDRVGSWRKHAEALAPARRLLESAGIRLSP